MLKRAIIQTNLLLNTYSTLETPNFQFRSFPLHLLNKQSTKRFISFNILCHKTSQFNFINTNLILFTYFALFFHNFIIFIYNCFR